MHFVTRAKSRRPDGICRFGRLASLLSGGMLLQAAAGGCQESLSSIAAALGQPLATGIGNGLSNLLQAFIVGVFI